MNLYPHPPDFEATELKPDKPDPANDARCPDCHHYVTSHEFQMGQWFCWTVGCDCHRAME